MAAKSLNQRIYEAERAAETAWRRGVAARERGDLRKAQKYFTRHSTKDTLAKRLRAQGKRAAVRREAAGRGRKRRGFWAWFFGTGG